MNKIPKQFLYNQSFNNRAIAFNQQLPVNLAPPFGAEKKMVPVGSNVQEDGSVHVTMYAPNASAVTAFHEFGSTDLKKGEGGIWSGVLEYPDPGLKQLQFTVDGSEVMNPMAPIAYGWSKPLNYIDIPDTDCDFLLLKDVPHGTITHEIFKSQTTGEYETCLVYTPPGYEKDLATEYPVVYLQHGGGENEMCWTYMGKINYIMDNLLNEGKAVPSLIVMNNGMVQVDDGKGRKSVDMIAVIDLILDDCIPMIESKYRVKPGKENRAIAGLSMGALQSAKMIMEHTDMFTAAGLFSAFTSPRKSMTDFDHLSSLENAKYLKAMDNAEYFNKEVKLFFRSVGDQEESVKTFEGEKKLCDEKGINYVERIYPGAHEWRVWRRAAYDFMQLVFK